MGESQAMMEMKGMLAQVQELLPEFEGRPGANDLAQVAQELQKDIAHIRQMELDMARWEQRKE